MNIDQITLISGVGMREANKLCVMSLTALIAGEPHGDHPVCACPVLTAVAIRVNDASWWDSDADRTEVLKPLSAALVGTRDPALELPRSKLFADRALRVWAPAALEAAANVHPFEEHRNALRGHAKKLRADGSDANAAYAAANAANAAYAAANAAYAAYAAAANADAAYAAANADANAANAANAAANAAYAAYAAAADADANADAYAADAADAAANAAANADAARKEIRGQVIAAIYEAIALQR